MSGKGKEKAKESEDKSEGEKRLHELPLPAVKGTIGAIGELDEVPSSPPMADAILRESEETSSFTFHIHRKLSCSLTSPPPLSSPLASPHTWSAQTPKLRCATTKATKHSI